MVAADLVLAHIHHGEEDDSGPRLVRARLRLNALCPPHPGVATPGLARHWVRHLAGSRVQGSGFGVQGSGFRVQGSGFGVQGSGFRVQGSRFRVQGAGFKVQGSGFGVQGLTLVGGESLENTLRRARRPECV